MLFDDLPLNLAEFDDWWSLSKDEFDYIYWARLEFPWPSSANLEDQIIEEVDRTRREIWNLFPLHLRFPYYFLIRDLSKSPGVENFRLIVSDHDKDMARMHQMQTGFPAIVIPAQSPKTSSTLLIDSHVGNDHKGLVSEAHKRCQRTLDELKRLDERYDFPDLRFFTDWVDPFDTSHLCPSDENLRELAEQSFYEQIV